MSLGLRRRLDPLADLRRLDEQVVAAELLEDRHQARVEEAELEQHQERQRAVDARWSSA